MKDQSRVKREIFRWRISQGLKDKSTDEGISQGLKDKSTDEG